MSTSDKSSQKSKQQTADHKPTGPKGTHQPTTTPVTSRQNGPFYAAGPAVSLGAPVQTKVAIGRPNDTYEREADTVAEHVVNNRPAPPISSINPGTFAGIAQREEEEEAVQPMPLQRQEEEGEETAVQAQFIQREEEEEAAQTMPLQRQEEEGEDTAVQAQFIQREEEEEAAQTMPLQRQEEEGEETAVQAQFIQREEEEEAAQTMPLQKNTAPSSASSSGSSMQQAASHAINSKGVGEPLNPDTRQQVESSIGSDLSDVRVHQDHAAQESAGALNARAFTHGSDIWLGRGESQDDVGLMAHEATHVVQQTGSIQRKLVQRADENTSPPSASATSKIGNLKTGLLDPAAGTITFDTIQIPKFKKEGHRGELYDSHSPLKRAKGQQVARKGEDATKQRENWKKDSDMLTSVRKMLEDKLNEATAQNPPSNGPYVFEVKMGDQYRYYFGNLDDIAKQLIFPEWSLQGNKAVYKHGRGKSRGFEVDHIVEAQLANWPNEKWADNIENLELLDGHKNQKLGDNIKGNINAKIDKFAKATKGVNGKKFNKGIKGNREIIKSNYTLVFNTSVGKGGPAVGKEGKDYWTKNKIVEGAHLKPVHAVSAQAIGGEDRVRIFSQPGGGLSRLFTWKASTKPLPVKRKDEKQWLSPFEIKNKYFKTDAASIEDKDFGYFKVDLRPDHPLLKSDNKIQDVPIKRVENARYGGMINKQYVLEKLKNIDVVPFSPIALDNFDIDPATGINAQARILPKGIPLLDKVDIGLEIVGGDIIIKKEFTPDELNFPKPFELRQSTLAVFYSNKRGFGLQGQLDFGIEKVGEGSLKASFTKTEGFGLKGKFSFDSTLFKPAIVSFEYRKGELSAQGTIGIKSGVVRGVRKAEATVSYSKDKFSARGSAELNMPGVTAGTLEVDYSETEGLMVGGSFDLSSDIPGIKSGNVRARVKRNKEGKWALSAGIKAKSNVPGLTSAEFTGIYEDGFFELGFSGDFERGIAKGNVTIGVTNKPVDETGKPTVGDPTKDLIFWGSGKVTVRLTQWLQATAGLKFDKDGGVSIVGKLEVPKEIEIIPDSATPDFGPVGPKFKTSFPIVSIGVADVSVTIGGGLGVKAQVGAGVLKDVGLEIFYDFDDESKAYAKGTAQFHMPAYAGINAYVSVGLRGRALIVTAGGEVILSGDLGLKGAADLPIAVDWSPAKGFSFKATPKVILTPELKVSVKGRLYVDIDYWVGSKTVWKYKKTIAEKSMGSNLKFGMVGHVLYSEAKGLEKPKSTDDIDFVYPSKDEVKKSFSDFIDDLF